MNTPGRRNAFVIVTFAVFLLLAFLAIGALGAAWAQGWAAARKASAKKAAVTRKRRAAR